MLPSPRFFKAIRVSHLYLGVFAAPALLLFAFTGGLQTFSLHETTRGSSYAPPAWLATAAQLHKKQTVVLPVRRARPAEVAPAPAEIAAAGSSKQMSAQPLSTVAEPRVPKKNLLPMKIFFALVSVSLLLSTLTGVYMGYRCSRSPKLVTAAWVAGLLVPTLLLLL